MSAITVVYFVIVLYMYIYFDNAKDKVEGLHLKRALKEKLVPYFLIINFYIFLSFNNIIYNNFYFILKIKHKISIN